MPWANILDPKYDWSEKGKVSDHTNAYQMLQQKWFLYTIRQNSYFYHILSDSFYQSNRFLLWRTETEDVVYVSILNGRQLRDPLYDNNNIFIFIFFWLFICHFHLYQLWWNNNRCAFIIYHSGECRFLHRPALHYIHKLFYLLLWSRYLSTQSHHKMVHSSSCRFGRVASL